MYIGNERVKGEILDSREARRIYEDIVRRMRDPGLLEYMGRNLFRARVYPIPARGEKRVQISYTEVLKAENGLVKYLYPLNTERFSRDPLTDVSISVRIESQVPIVNVYSPSHKVSVRKEGEGLARVGYEEKDVRPDKDFLLYYSLSKDDIGLSFMNWEGPGGGLFHAPGLAALRRRRGEGRRQERRPRPRQLGQHERGQDHPGQGGRPLHPQPSRPARRVHPHRFRRRRHGLSRKASSRRRATPSAGPSSSSTASRIPAARTSTTPSSPPSPA